MVIFCLSKGLELSEREMASSQKFTQILVIKKKKIYIKSVDVVYFICNEFHVILKWTKRLLNHAKK
jgi:hypothetical protein